MKKVLALFLSLVMVLALIPTAFAAGEVAVAVSEALVTGDKIVIYNGSANGLISATASGNKLSAVASTPAEGSLIVPTGAAVFDVTAQVNGETTEYALSVGGKYLTSGSTGNSLTLNDTLTDLGWWILETVEGEDGYLVKNKSAAYSGKS